MMKQSGKWNTLKFQWNHQIKFLIFIQSSQKKNFKKISLNFDWHQITFSYRDWIFFVYSHQVNMREKERELQNSEQTTIFMRDYIIKLCLRPWRIFFLLSHCLTLTFMFIALALTAVLIHWLKCIWSYRSLSLSLMCHYPWV